MAQDSFLLAGYVYCALGALSLLDRPTSPSSLNPQTALNTGIPNRKGLLQFLAYRQFEYLAEKEEGDLDDENLIQAKLGQLDLGEGCSHVGFNGRWNKKADTCYCWWVGASLEVSLGSSTLHNPLKNADV